MKLCSDRFFSERIMGRHVGMRRRFPAMPQMIFGEKASRFFCFKLNMLLSVPVQVMNRYSLYWKAIHASSNQTVSAPVFNPIFSPFFSGSVRQESHRAQGIQDMLAAHGALAAASSRLSHARTAANAVTQAFSSFVGKLSAMSRHPFFPAIRRRRWDGRALYGSAIRHERFFTSFARQFGLRAHRIFVDQISKKQSMLREELMRRPETPVFALKLGNAGIHGAPERSRQSLAEKAQELIFRDADKIGREIDKLKRIVEKTEDGIREKVARQVKEIMTERNRQVDVGSLTLQVYRNMERMIRIERERRGV